MTDSGPKCEWTLLGGMLSRRLPSSPPVLAGYSYVRPLGAGGFADVFLFEQDMPRRPVAVKVMLEQTTDAALVRMFNAEADIMARLSSHPSILTVYEASVSADGRPYLVMEYCPASLTNRYRKERMPVAEVLHIGVKMAGALETAHRAGLLHRDIKPSNILITTFGSPVLSDFGIAGSLAGGRDDDVFAMSVPWGAPEVVEERGTGTVASEVWSLGATVYTLLAGRSPFERSVAGQNGREQLRARISRATYTRIGRDDVPRLLEDVLEGTMRRLPADRYGSALEVAEELRLVQREMGLTATALEVASDEWAMAGAAIDFDNMAVRGPARPTVPHESARRPRERKPRPAVADVVDGTVLAGGAVPVRRRSAQRIWLIVGGLALAFAVTAAVVAAVLALGGR